MLLDHFGVLFFPKISIFRILGRIAFPIFAFFIAEGCRYTRDKRRYFLTVFSLGVLFQCVYAIVEETPYYGVLITFSLSILLAYALQWFKDCLFAGVKAWKSVLVGALFIALVAGVYALNRAFVIDYGFWGCLAPALVSLTNPPKNAPAWWGKFVDRSLVKLALLGGALVGIWLKTGYSLQVYSLFALPLLFLYSGKRGKWKMKYFFYIFYPAHLALLYGVWFLINL